MKKILILSELKSGIEDALSGKYELTGDINCADLVIFDGEKGDIQHKKSLAIFQSTITEGTYSDFITFPFKNDELIFRVSRLISSNSVFKNGSLIIDTSHSTVFLRGNQIHLTMLEYKLLCLLARSCGQTVDYQTIMRELWGSPIGSEIRSVRVFVNALRKKLGSDEIIKNVMGKGYVMSKIAK